MKVLITGFGPFPGVPHNPTAAVAQAVDGVWIGAHRVCSVVLPVSWARGPELAIAAAREHGARLVVGLGVAARRPRVCVERLAVRVDHGLPDVDGHTAPALAGPDRALATLDVARLAEALGAELSDDAGRYVCNAWLYRVSRALEVPVGFVHVPADGIAPERLLTGIEALLDGDGPRPFATEPPKA